MKSSSWTSATSWYCRWWGLGFVGCVIGLLAGNAGAQEPPVLDPFYFPCVPHDWSKDGFIAQSKALYNQEDVNQFLNCTTVYQSITIYAYNTTELSLNNIETLLGSLKITENPWDQKLRKVSAPHLKTVVQDFSLDALSLLEELDIPVFESASTLTWTNLPLLKSFPWLPKSVSLSFVNKYALSLTGFEVKNTSVEAIDCFSFPENPESKEAIINILDNRNLTRLEFGNMTAGPGQLMIADNNPGLRVAFENMTTAGNLTFSNLASLDMPVLVNATGNLTLSNNTFQHVELPLLNLVGGSLNIISNQNLERMNFPLLSRIGFLDNGNLEVLGNPAVEVVDGFNSFDFAYGVLKFQGNFSAINIPVDGVTTFSISGVRIETSDKTFNCSYWAQLVDKQWSYINRSIFSCHTPNNTDNDISLLNGVNQEKNTLTKDVYSVLIGVSILICVFGVGIVFHYVKNWKKRKIAMEAADRQRVEEIELAISGVNRRDEAGVVRMVEDEADRPPTYSRVPKPGEVPPCYLEVMDGNEGRNREANDTATTEASTTEPVRAPQEPPPTFVEPARPRPSWLIWMRHV